MRDFKNRLSRSLEMYEMEGLIEVGKILSKTFKRPIFGVTVNPNEHCKSDVWGIAFCLDLDPKK